MDNSITDIFLHCMILVEINIILNEIDLSLALFLSNFCLTEKAMGRNNHILGLMLVTTIFPLEYILFC